VMQNGVQGFMAANDDEWIEGLLKLVDDAALRKRMGVAGRKTVEELFSVNANFPKYLQVFKTVIPDHE
jgi:hypothetical protein